VTERSSQTFFSSRPEPECLMDRRIGVCDLDAVKRQLIRITIPLRTDELRNEGATHMAIGRRALAGCSLACEGVTCRKGET
jgi:hypothetical protein